MSLARCVARAWRDDAFKAKLFAEPAAALSEMGVAVPEGVTVWVREGQPKDRAGFRPPATEFKEAPQILILPPAPVQLGDVSLEELEAVVMRATASAMDCTDSSDDGCTSTCHDICPTTVTCASQGCRSEPLGPLL